MIVLSKSYEKLTEDLVQARTAAEKVAIGEDSGEICLESLAIKIPHAKANDVINAINKAGLTTYGAQVIDKMRYFIIGIKKCGYRSSRHRAIEKLHKEMLSRGYIVRIHTEPELER